jgi:hypothetical protein
MLGMALWSQSSGARESVSDLLSRSQTNWVRLTCDKIVSRPGQVRARACMAVVAWRCSFNAVQVRVSRERKACVLGQERNTCS